MIHAIKSKLNYAGVIAIIFFGAASLVGVNLICAKVLSVEDYGKVSLLFTLIAFIISFGMFGLNQSLVRELVGRAGTPAISQGTFLIFLLLTISVSVISAAAVRMIYGAFFPSQNMVVLLTSFFITLALLLSTLARSAMRFLRAQLLLQFWKIALFLATLIMAYCSGPMSLSGIALTIIITTALSCIFFINGGVVIRRDSAPAINLKKVFLEGGLFVGIMASLSLLGTIDRFAIPKVLGYGAMGNYNIYFTLLVGPFVLLHSGITYVLMPKFREKFSQGNLKHYLSGIYRLAPKVAVISLILFAALYFATDFVIEKLYHGKYEMAASVKIVLLIMGGVRLFYAFLSSLLGGTATYWELAVSNAVGFLSLGFVIAAILLLGPGGGIMGIALSLLAGWILRCAGWIWLSNKALNR